MSEQRLKVQSGPPQHMIDEPVQPSQPIGDADGAGTTEQAKQTAAQAREKVQAVAGDVAGQAKERAQDAASKAKDRASAQVDERTTQAGEQIGEQAQALDGVAGELREQGREGPAKVAEQASQRVKKAGEYLRQADGEELVGKAQQIAQENPAAAAAVGAAAGFVAGRVLKASSPDDPEETTEGRPSAPSQETP
jgi:ElaB/YqjD/DUF883 family membrane-anchored ribosome-binding protein